MAPNTRARSAHEGEPSRSALHRDAHAPHSPCQLTHFHGNRINYPALGALYGRAHADAFGDVWCERAQRYQTGVSVRSKLCRNIWALAESAESDSTDIFGRGALPFPQAKGYNWNAFRIALSA